MQYSILELRARKRLTQKQVVGELEESGTLKVSYQAYCAWEKDLSKVAIGKVAKLADYFGVSINEIAISPNFSAHEQENNSCNQDKDSAVIRIKTQHRKE